MFSANKFKASPNANSIPKRRFKNLTTACFIVLLSVNAVIGDEHFNAYPLAGIDAAGIASRILLTEEEKTWIARARPIRIKVEELPPFQINGPTVQGISIDYLHLFCSGFGLECQFITDNKVSNTLHKNRLDNSFDLLPGLERSPELKQNFALTHEYSSTPWVVFTRSGSMPVLNLRFLRRKKLAVAHNGISEKLKANDPAIQLFEFNTPKSALDALSQGAVDAYLDTLAGGVYWIRKEDFRNIEMAGPAPFTNLNLVMGVRSDWPELATIINKFLAAMTADQHVAINNRWFTFDNEKRIDRGNVGHLLSAVFFLIVAIMVVIIVNHRLKKEIRKRAIVEQKARRSYELLHCIDELREQFIKDDDPSTLFSALLEHLLQLTGSRYGLIGDVLSDEGGDKYLKAYAISNLSWDAETRRLYENAKRQGFEFRNLNNLLGLPIVNGQTVIANAPNQDPRGAGFPDGHPEILSFLGIPVYYGERLVGEVGLANRNGGFDPSIAKWISPVTSALGQIIVARWEREARLEAENKLRRLATTDPLTKIGNRNQFINFLHKLTARIKRYPEPLSLLMIDIDHFKSVNDNFGHKAGDRILVELVKLVEKTIRNVDLFARWGGEEFLILLPNSDMEAGRQLAERIRHSVEKHIFSQPGHITISIGITAYHQDDTQKSFLDRVDQALYKAKHGGRNRVEWT